METIKKYIRPEVTIMNIDNEAVAAFDKASPGYAGDTGDTSNWDAKEDHYGFGWFDDETEDEEIY